MDAWKKKWRKEEEICLQGNVRHQNNRMPHIELANKRRQIAVLEELRYHFCFESCAILYENLCQYRQTTNKGSPRLDYE